MADARRERQRRLRSGTVVLGGMGLLAAALTACSSEPDKRCVDRDSYDHDRGYRVVSDKNCKSGSGSTSGAYGKSRKSRSSGYGWYYGGDSGDGRVGGGSFTKSGSGKGGSGVSRGGFGGGKGSSGG